jgi:RimJ/RimL family protein N-acetyltransferase
MIDLFKGEKVRLVAADPEKIAGPFSRWSRDSEYWRLMAFDAAHPSSERGVKEWLEKDLAKADPSFYMFFIQPLDSDEIIGDIGLDVLDSEFAPHGDTYVGISIGNRNFWGKGYGTDAMRVLLRYAFTEINLHRVTLNVFEYNPRAIRSYEKAGFVHEGRLRGMLNKDGRRWDILHMGILRQEWLTGEEKRLSGVETGA